MYGPPDLDTKLATFDEHARDAAGFVVKWLAEHSDDFIAVARGRHVTGHLLFGNANFAEWDENRLRKEICEEISDAIVYATRLIVLSDSNPTMHLSGHRSSAHLQRGSEDRYVDSD